MYNLEWLQIQRRSLWTQAVRLCVATVLLSVEVAQVLSNLGYDARLALGFARRLLLEVRLIR